MKFAAPRILNAPPRWKFSHLKNTLAPASESKVREVNTGVRCTSVADALCRHLNVG